MNKTGCRRQLADSEWFNFCGETDMGQTMPALCTDCGGNYKLSDKYKKTSIEIIPKPIINLLIKHGFSLVDGCDDSESLLYYYKEVEGSGVVWYGAEYNLYTDDGWTNKSELGFYFWSGLGSYDSYAFFIPSEGEEAVRDLCEGLQVTNNGGIER